MLLHVSLQLALRKIFYEFFPNSQARGCKIGVIKNACNAQLSGWARDDVESGN